MLKATLRRKMMAFCSGLSFKPVFLSAMGVKFSATVWLFDVSTKFMLWAVNTVKSYSMVCSLRANIK